MLASRAEVMMGGGVGGARMGNVPRGHVRKKERRGKQINVISIQRFESRMIRDLPFFFLHFNQFGPKLIVENTIIDTDI